MIRLNELTDPSERAAWTRVDTLFGQLDALPEVALMTLPVPGLPPEEREAGLEQVRSLAHATGRDELLTASMDHLGSALGARLAGPVQRYRTNWARPDDIAAILRAVTDALAVTVVEDRLDPTLAAALAGPGRQLLGLDSPVPASGPVSAHQGRVRIEEPSADDWADAAAGEAVVDRGATLIGGRGVRTGLLAFIAIMALPGAGAMGFASGNTLLGLVGGLAVVLVCWTLAAKP